MKPDKMSGFATEVPGHLKQLARIVAQGFYQPEDVLIIDMLVRNVCMKERDIGELLKLDAKSLRARLLTLRGDRFVQFRSRMETTGDGNRNQKAVYYFINYKSLVNVVKYKLDHMRKRLGTQEKNKTHRFTFKCTNCIKTYSELDAGNLFEPTSKEFRCVFCGHLVEEDDSQPKRDPTVMLARFNEQMEVLFELVRKAENTKLSLELLEPQPPSDKTQLWSGEATRTRGKNNPQIAIKIEKRASPKKKETETKERPIWLLESSIEKMTVKVESPVKIEPGSLETAPKSAVAKPSKDDIMSILLASEKKGPIPLKPIVPKKVMPIPASVSKSKTSQPTATAAQAQAQALWKKLNANMHQPQPQPQPIKMEVVRDSDSDDDSMEEVEDRTEQLSLSLVVVGKERYPIGKITPDIIARMTPYEKDTYIQQYQDKFGHLHE